jgi:hypothetical protein
MPPRVFCEKRLQAVENKGWELQKERQESLRACKRKELKEMEEVNEVEDRVGATFVRVGGEDIGVGRAGLAVGCRQEISFASTFASSRLEVGRVR